MAPVSCKEQDFLQQDQAVRGQNYVCLSFLSPTDAVSSLQAFTVSKFLGAFAEEAAQVLGDAEAKANTPEDKAVISNLRERYAYLFDKDTLRREFDNYNDTYGEQLKSDWASENDNQACVYGIKIRGTYETLQEAQTRAQQLKRVDPNFSVYVCEVGCWVPWSPHPDQIADAEYSETQLNTLMKKYKENMALKDEYYEARKRDMVKASESVAEADGTSFSADHDGKGSTASASDVMSAMK